MGDLTKNFSKSEFTCHCGCGTFNIDLSVLCKLQNIRDRVKKPVTVHSGCRCPKHNKEVGGVQQSRHIATADKKSDAADIEIPGLSVDQIAQELLKEGFKGIGIYRKKGFVHGDLRDKITRWEG